MLQFESIGKYYDSLYLVILVREKLMYIKITLYFILRLSQLIVEPDKF